MRQSLPSEILTDRVIPVARGATAESAAELARSLSRAGFSTLEVTVEREGAFDAIAAVESTMRVGAGTITTADQARDAVAAGASFLVSPHFDPNLTRTILSMDIPYIPAGLTPTEIRVAWSTSVAAVKLFPASLFGASYLTAIRGPFPEIVLVPTGGIDATNVRGFLEAGAAAVGVGSWLTGQSSHDQIVKRGTQLLDEVV